jgi:hypothetical protein
VLELLPGVVFDGRQACLGLLAVCGCLWLAIVALGRALLCKGRGEALASVLYLVHACAWLPRCDSIVSFVAGVGRLPLPVASGVAESSV